MMRHTNRPSGVSKRPAVFFSHGGQKALQGLSKTAWQDIAWNLAARLCGEADNPEKIREELLDEAQTTVLYRAQDAKLRAAGGLALLLVLVAASGCATMVNGTSQAIFFDSEPQGAEIDYKGTAYTTPCLISLTRSHQTVTLPVYKSGFAPQAIECKVRETGLIFGNIFFGGIVGVLVDGVTAGSKKYTEENHKAFLLPVDDVYAQEFDVARAAAKVKAAAEAKRRKAEEDGRLSMATRRP